MLELREPLSVGAANVLDVLGTLSKVGGKARALADHLPPLLLPRSGIPLFLCEVGVYRTADHH